MFHHDLFSPVLISFNLLCLSALLSSFLFLFFIPSLCNLFHPFLSFLCFFVPVSFPHFFYSVNINLIFFVFLLFFLPLFSFLHSFLVNHFLLLSFFVPVSFPCKSVLFTTLHYLLNICSHTATDLKRRIHEWMQSKKRKWNTQPTEEQPSVYLSSYHALHRVNVHHNISHQVQISCSWTLLCALWYYIIMTATICLFVCFWDEKRATCKAVCIWMFECRRYTLVSSSCTEFASIHPLLSASNQNIVSISAVIHHSIDNCMCKGI